MTGAVAVMSGGVGSNTLRSDFGLGTNYSADGYAAAGTATGTLTLTVKSDGTWTVTGVGTVGGTPLTGNWAQTPAGGIGTTHEVKITSTAGAFDSNAAAAFTALSVNRAAAVTVTDGVPNGVETTDTVTFNVEVRLIGTTSPLSMSTGVVFNVSAYRDGA